MMKMMMRWAGHVARVEESRNAYSVLVGIPEGKRPLGRARHTWRIILKWVSKRWVVILEPGCKSGNEPLDSLKANYCLILSDTSDSGYYAENANGLEDISVFLFLTSRSCYDCS